MQPRTAGSSLERQGGRGGKASLGKRCWSWYGKNRKSIPARGCLNATGVDPRQEWVMLGPHLPLVQGSDVWAKMFPSVYVSPKAWIRPV